MTRPDTYLRRAGRIALLGMISALTAMREALPEPAPVRAVCRPVPKRTDDLLKPLCAKGGRR